MSGLAGYQRIRQVDAASRLIFVTQPTSTDTAIEALRAEPSNTLSSLALAASQSAHGGAWSGALMANQRSDRDG